jgi:hypothetical protein
VICEKTYPEVSPVPVASRVLPPPAIPLPSTQPSLARRPPHPFTAEENEYNRYSITRSYVSLAGELSRLTEALGELDPRGDAYKEMVGEVKRVTKILCTMTTLIDEYR